MPLQSDLCCALLLLLLVAGGLGACDATVPTRAPGTFEATISGVYTLQASGPALTSTFTIGSATRQILLGNGHPPGITFFRFHDTTFVPGTYAIGVGGGGIHAIVSLAEQAEFSYPEATDGVLTITQAGRGWLAGTFRFRAFPHFDTAASPTVVEGSFRAPLP